jgi:septation ring formation regulator EzrA
MDEFDQKIEKQIDDLNDIAAVYEDNVDRWELLIKEKSETFIRLYEEAGDLAGSEMDLKELQELYTRMKYFEICKSRSENHVTAQHGDLIRGESDVDPQEATGYLVQDGITG